MSGQQRASAGSEAFETRGRQLKSWKEIAAFFRCDERTVRRWEDSRGLPVRRMQGGARSPVFAYENELRAWLEAAPGESAPTLEQAGPSQNAVPAAAPLPSFPRWLAIVMGALLFFAVAAGIAYATLDKPYQRQRAIAEPARDSSNAEARKFYEAGLYGWQSRTPAGLRQAVDDFTQAIVRDPQYAKAYAGLADCYNLLRAYTGMPDGYAFPRAKAAAERAIALDPSLADAHAALGFVDLYWSRETAQAAREFQASIRLAPRNATAHHWYAVYLATLRRFPQALVEIERAHQIDTASGSILAAKGLILFLSGRTGEAAELLRRLEQVQPQLASPHFYLAAIAGRQGDDVQFVSEMSAYAASAQHPADRAIAQAARRGLKAGGHRGMLLAMLGTERQLLSQGTTSAYTVAQTYAELGDAANALRYLRLSFQRRETGVVSLNVQPEFRELRKLPAFQDLVRQAGV